MEDKDILTLKKILKHKNRPDLANLLEGAKSEIDPSGQFGSYYNSVISTFVIFAPVETYYKLKEVVEEDKKLLLASSIDMYPSTAGEYEVVDVEFRILSEQANTEPQPETMGGKSDVEVFISYSTEDKLTAAEVKRALTDAGLAAFLAHEDIRPSAEWVEVILDNLASCDVFVTLITDNFRPSDWTAQEAGYALAKDKLIIPISIANNTPYGFIGKFQALKFVTDQPYIESQKLVEIIIERGQTYQFKYRLINALIEKFVLSSSFEDAGEKATRLTKVVDFDTEQINKIFKGACENNQIYKSWSAQTPLRSLYEKYKDRISEESLKDLKIKIPALFPQETDIPF